LTTQIAWLLGYEGLTFFNHAFLRWSGPSPTAIRKGRPRYDESLLCGRAAWELWPRPNPPPRGLGLILGDFLLRLSHVERGRAHKVAQPGLQLVLPLSAPLALD